MSCLNIRKNISKLSHKFRRALCLERKPRQRKIEISAPFDFKSGPKVNFPGFSESEISLMKEKAIASTAVSPSDEDATFDFPQKRESYPLSHARVASSGGGSIRKRVIEHTRKISRGHFH